MSKARKAVKVRSRARLRAFVAQAVETISRRMIEELGIDAAKAEEIARNCAHDICSTHGGAFMYIPKDMEFTLTARDMLIYERYNGRNMQDLVAEFGVTHTRIYQIVAQIKAQMISERQGVLQGFGE